MDKTTKQKNIVKAIQVALSDAKLSRIENGLTVVNNCWNENLNFVHSALMKLNGKYGLRCFSFNRYAYKIICLYDTELKTLYTLCSKNNLEKLMQRSAIYKYHYNDALCLLSSVEGREVQLNMFGDEVEIKTKENLNSLLHKLILDFDSEIDVENFAILEYTINHGSCELFNICAKFFNKGFELLGKDESWSKFIAYEDYEEMSGNSPVVKSDDGVSVRLKNNVLSKEN